MCSDTVIALLSLFVILSILFAGFYIAYKADIENIYILNSIKNFVIDLFKDRNILGKFLSSVVFIIYSRHVIYDSFSNSGCSHKVIYKNMEVRK